MESALSLGAFQGIGRAHLALVQAACSVLGCSLDVGSTKERFPILHPSVTLYPSGGEVVFEPDETSS